MTNSEPIITSLNHVVGQRRAVTLLRTALDAYWHDRSKHDGKEAFPHLLMCGPGGTGKTLLTELIGRELCTECHVELAQNIGNSGQMQGLLMMLEAEHILLIDEIHELSETVQVSLYRALEERKLFIGGNRKPVNLPPFTLIGATTDEYLLTQSMRDRFKILLRLTHYSDDEMASLISQRAKRLGWEIDADSIAKLASRSRGVPRLAVRLLDSAKRVASSKASDNIDPDHIEEMLAIEGFDALGFDPVEQRYLSLLKQHQGPVRLNVIATHLGLPKQTIEMFERDFIRLGLISKGDRGRSLTPKGIEHLGGLHA
ncbi:Holliday junction DNA helicase RuvB C-terminal domain-containing protein [Lignipirellula cremea]|uniref:Holliday junction ATP-dependent DNA helicase RuvB n=1 Tax=Lignipirellula cremea TaxID=2528010 RepID=A0A518DWK5_9BACT|nr:Holliday junction DNA helicase RuvB C-terminal domain-containing protein [Lignipirellula cremea]QDU94066.1 Holliday junction ATP-dependent DNA helicase RuvB [Lignipirellula cremea]QDU96217.1 Holliday junction ATP-dependent DNA helicase RuvB [Lignipirellula cremea]